MHALRMRCAECACEVEAGHRVVACGSAACCCADVPRAPSAHGR